MAKTRNSYTKIKNFTEKDQVRLKYSYIGKDKKLMLSVYIGEDVYNELTNGQTFKRLKVEYIPNDMVIITPTNNEKEGIVHRYNGKGLFKTTCVRLSLSSYKKLKIRKKDFSNRVVSYSIVSGNYAMNNRRLNIDLIGSKKPKFVNKIDLNDVVPQDYVSNSKIKPLEISAPKEVTPDHFLNEVFKDVIDYTPMFVTHHFLNDVRDGIENRLLAMEERFEKRIQEIENLLKEFMGQPLRPLKPSKEDIYNNVKVMKEELEKRIFDTEEQFVKRILMQEEYYAQKLDMVYKVNDELIKLKRSNENIELDIVKDSINAMGKEIVELNAKLFNIESKINLLLQKAEFKNYHENKSLMERIFGKD